MSTPRAESRTGAANASHVLRCSACDAECWIAFDEPTRDAEVAAFISAHVHRSLPVRAFLSLVDLETVPDTPPDALLR